MRPLIGDLPERAPTLGCARSWKRYQYGNTGTLWLLRWTVGDRVLMVTVEACLWESRLTVARWLREARAAMRREAGEPQR